MIINKSLTSQLQVINTYINGKITNNNLVVNKQTSIKKFANTGNNNSNCTYVYVNGYLNRVICTSYGGGGDNTDPKERGEGYVDPKLFDQMPEMDFAGGGESYHYDCIGVLNGEAYIGDCGQCIGGTTGISSCAEVAVVEAPTENIDLQKLLDCFENILDNANTKYKVTLHVELADPNYPMLAIVSNGSVGHAYITLEKSNGSDRRVLSYGFYPRESSILVPLKYVVPSGMGEESSNDKRRSDISYPVDITKATFDQIINTSIQNSSKQYDLNSYNCTNYAVDVFNKAIPTHPIQASGYSTPSNLYSKVKALSPNYPIQRNLKGWNNPGAPISSDPCN